MLQLIPLVLLAVVLQAVDTVPGASCTPPLVCISAQECSARLGDKVHLYTFFACGQNEKSVCCPQETSTSGSLNKTSSADAKKQLLPISDQCPLGTNDRIMGGDNATLGQFPWMALLGYRVSPNEPVEFRCGGTIINNRYVLTAAHCLQAPDKAKLEIVRLNELFLDTDPDCMTFLNITTCSKPVMDVKIEKSIRHNQYNTPYLQNDIALIRLDKNITFNPDNIRPICLPFGLTITGNEEANYTAAGWGRTDNFAEGGSTILQHVVLASVPLTDCKLLLSTPLSTKTQLCAGGSLGKDSCKGDSGGPLMSIDKFGNVFQIGIVSFGSTSCGKDVPSVYTRVTSFLNWILENIEP